MGDFRKATRQKVRASIMIEGPSGSGKSGLALMIAQALVPDWDKIYCIDTENQALDLFEGVNSHLGKKFGAFNKADLTSIEGFAPTNYVKLKEEAKQAGAEVVIMDSISHMWNRKGGMLDLVTEATKQNSTNNKFNAWGTDRNILEKQTLIDIIRDNNVHTITTVRMKEGYALELDPTTGKNKVVCLGLQQEQQDGLKYEPDLVLTMVRPGNADGTAPIARVWKSRYVPFVKDQEYEFTADVLKQLHDYLAEGVDPDELLAAQHADYEERIKEYCNTPGRKSIWNNLKEGAGFKDTKIKDIPLKNLKEIYIKLTEE